MLTHPRPSTVLRAILEPPASADEESRALETFGYWVRSLEFEADLEE